MEGIPDRVLSLIEASGLSRRAFAQDIGLDDSKLSKSLSGARRFSSLDLARIADRCERHRRLAGHRGRTGAGDRGQDDQR